MALDLTPLIPVYQDAIDAIIDQMGKGVTLYFKPTITNINDSFRDKIRQEETILPEYMESNAPTIVENTKTIKALIKMNPTDFRNFGFRTVNQPDGVIRLKTFLADVPDLVKCEYIIPNLDAKNIVYSKYKLLREPIPQGLKENRYAISFWERI